MPSKLSFDTTDDSEAPEANSVNFLRMLKTAVLSSVSFMLLLTVTQAANNKYIVK